MKFTANELKKRMYREEFPRANGYDCELVLRNQMGPNVLWLTEFLSQSLPLRPGMRILDLGCGKGLSSIFLSREYDVQVWAYDLWIPASENWERIKANGLEGRVFPIHGRATDLPFADSFFDAVVAIDSYHYFGTDDLFLNYITRFVKPGGFLGILVPGFMQEIGDTVPEHLIRPQSHGGIFWREDCWTFHTKDWWFNHWNRSSLVADVEATILPKGWELWYEWEKLTRETGHNIFPSDEEVLAADKGTYLGFISMTAVRKGDVAGVSFPE